MLTLQYNKVNKLLMPKEVKKQYITVLELSKMLGISRVAVFKRIQKGQIPAEKIGRNYAIPVDFALNLVKGIDTANLTEERKETITKAVEKLVDEYGETLKLLGKE